MDGNKFSQCNKTLRECRAGLRKKMRAIKRLEWETENYSVEKQMAKADRHNKEVMKGINGLN